MVVNSQSPDIRIEPPIGTIGAAAAEMVAAEVIAAEMMAAEACGAMTGGAAEARDGGATTADGTGVSRSETDTVTGVACGGDAGDDPHSPFARNSSAHCLRSEHSSCDEFTEWCDYVCGALWAGQRGRWGVLLPGPPVPRAGPASCPPVARAETTPQPLPGTRRGGLLGVQGAGTPGFGAWYPPVVPVVPVTPVSPVPTAHPL